MTVSRQTQTSGKRDRSDQGRQQRRRSVGREAPKRPSKAHTPLDPRPPPSPSAHVPRLVAGAERAVGARVDAVVGLRRGRGGAGAKGRRLCLGPTKVSGPGSADKGVSSALHALRRSRTQTGYQGSPPPGRGARTGQSGCRRCAPLWPGRCQTPCPSALDEGRGGQGGVGLCGVGRCASSPSRLRGAAPAPAHPHPQPPPHAA